MTAKNENSDLDDVCIGSDFDETAQNIASILKTGHPVDSKFNFSEIVLRGRNAMSALSSLRKYLNGDYNLIPVSGNGIRIPNTDKPKVFVINMDEFEEGIPGYIWDIILQRDDYRILAVDTDGSYPESGFPYVVRVDDIIY